MDLTTRVIVGSRPIPVVGRGYPAKAEVQAYLGYVEDRAIPVVDKVSRERRLGPQVYISAEYLMTANAAPCGSCSTANLPTFGMSIGGTNILAPSRSAFLAFASTSSTVI